MRLIRTIILFILFAYAESTWYFAEHKICDQTGESWLPFSGFRIHRKYVVKNLKPPMLHFVSMSHCDQGSLDYERLMRTGRETDIEWDKPVCIFQDGNAEEPVSQEDGIKQLKVTSDDKAKKKPNDSPKMKHIKSVNPIHNNIEKQKSKVGGKPKKIKQLSIDEVSKKPHSISTSNLLKNATTSTKLGKRSDNEKDHHRQTFNALVRKISSKARFIEYKQDSLITNLEDLDLMTYDELNSQNLNNLKCFKFARRKKYAQRQMMVYAPYTWVGGLFECNVNLETKKQYIMSLKDPRDFIKPFDFKCDPSQSTPLYPLIADDVTSQWIEKEKGVTIAQRIPYLYTPGVLDVRYGKSAKTLGVKNGQTLFEGHDMIKKPFDTIPIDHWFHEVEINEQYNYTGEDMNVLGLTTKSSANLFDQFLKSDKKFLQPWEWDLKDLLGHDNDGIGYLEQKFLSVMGRIKDKHVIDDFLVTVQEHWDNVTLSKESFKYKH